MRLTTCYSSVQSALGRREESRVTGRAALDGSRQTAGPSISQTAYLLEISAHLNPLQDLQRIKEKNDPATNIAVPRVSERFVCGNGGRTREKGSCSIFLKRPISRPPRRTSVTSR